MRQILSSHFFRRPTLVVALELLGKFIVRRWRGKEIALAIAEVEAYDGPNDLASHASHGRTERNKVMFGPAGFWYVYFTYGMHWMLNIVTGPKDYPAAILLRGAGDIVGPGRLTKFLHIDRHLNGKKANRASGLWIEDRGVKIEARNIRRTPRIGVAYAGAWAKKKYRFFLSSRATRSQGKGWREIPCQSH